MKTRTEPEPFRLSELLRPEGIGLHYEAQTPAEVLGQLNALLVRAGFIPPEDAPLARLAFMEQEEISGTAYKYGIAMPHGMGPWAMGAVIGVYPGGVGWRCRDGTDVRIAIGIAMPESGFRAYSLWLPNMVEILISGGFLEVVSNTDSPSRLLEAVETIEDAFYINDSELP